MSTRSGRPSTGSRRNFRHLARAAVTAAAIAPLFANQIPQSPAAAAGTALILGRVADASTGAAISDAVVTLFTPGPDDDPATLTTSDGSFVFRGVAAGNYQIGTEKNGYVSRRIGPDQPATSMKSIVLADGERVGDVVIRIWKLAAIEGRVLDEAGEPLVSVTVSAWSRGYSAGRPVFVEAQGGARTDDRGLYRISDLAPGDYVVGVVSSESSAPLALVDAYNSDRNSDAGKAYGEGDGPRLLPGASTSLQTAEFVRSIAGGRPVAPPAVDRQPLLTYATTFHPAATAVSRAEVIGVESGAERTGIDIRLTPVATARIAGRLTGAPDATAHRMVELYPAAGDDLQRPVPVATTMSDATGTFTLLGIPRGDYVIRVLRIPALPEVRTTQVVEMAGMTTTFVTTKAAEGVSPDPTWWSATPVAVSGRDVIDLAVPVAAGTRLRGRVVFEGSAPQPKPGDWLRIQSADGRRSTRGWRTLGAHVDERGGFLSPELPPGRYVLRASVVAPWTLKSVALNERDVADGVIEIGSDPAAVIVVTMIDVAAGVSGVVRTQENRADTDAAVVVFPVDRGQWTGYGETARRLRLARVDRAGRYALTGLPPGSYFIVAVPDAITDGWMNPAFLARVESRARRVELRAGEQQTLDLRTAVVR